MKRIINEKKNLSTKLSQHSIQMGAALNVAHTDNGNNFGHEVPSDKTSQKQSGYLLQGTYCKIRHFVSFLFRFSGDAPWPESVPIASGSAGNGLLWKPGKRAHPPPPYSVPIPQKICFCLVKEILQKEQSVRLQIPGNGLVPWVFKRKKGDMVLEFRSLQLRWGDFISSWRNNILFSLRFAAHWFELKAASLFSFRIVIFQAIGRNGKCVIWGNLYNTLNTILWFTVLVSADTLKNTNKNTVCKVVWCKNQCYSNSKIRNNIIFQKISKNLFLYV